MRRKYRIRGWLSAAGFLLSVTCSAQYTPTATEKVDRVAKAGIYRIVLPPPLVASCGNDLSDLRILDEYGKEAPYVLKTDIHDPLNAGFLPIPDPIIRQQDSSDRHSYYWLKYDDRYRIDRLSLVITRPALYKRTAVVSTVFDQGTAIPAVTISIDPGDSVFEVPSLNANLLMIDIANHDNAPLTIERVATAQSGIYLLAYLEPDHEYELAVDYKVGLPDYDLRYFTDNMRLTPVTIGLGPLHRLSVLEGIKLNQAIRNRRSSRKSELLLWGAVAVILLLLLYVSVKLARAVDKKGI